MMYHKTYSWEILYPNEAPWHFNGTKNHPTLLYTSICRVLENKYMFPPIPSLHSKDHVLHIKEQFDRD